MNSDGPDGGYAMVPAWLMRQQPTGVELQVYVDLALHGKFDQGRGLYDEITPSYARLAKRLRLSRDTVRRAVRGLEEKGAIQRETRPRDDKDNDTNRFRVIFGQVVGPGGGATSPGGCRCAPGAQCTCAPRGGAGVHPNPEPSYPEPIDPEELLLVGGAEAPPTRPDVERLCTQLADAIQANGSRRPAVSQRWRDAARLMIDKDGRQPEQIGKAIEWCQADEFWRSNVLSMPKLREQYDRLRLSAQRSTSGQPAHRLSTTDQRFAAGMDLADKFRREEANAA